MQHKDTTYRPRHRGGLSTKRRGSYEPKRRALLTPEQARANSAAYWQHTADTEEVAR